jgi:hypothetical protein
VDGIREETVQVSWVKALASSAGFLLLMSVTGCENSDPSDVMVLDSAGVRLTVSEDVQRVFAVLDSVPTLSLGGPEATGPTQFFRIQGIHVDPAGRLWVADGQSGELRIFEPDGSHWKTRGGRGEGPGEFVQIRLLGSAPGDTVLVGDGGLDRITVFSPEGEFVRTEVLPSSDRPAPRPFDVFSDGSILGQVPRVVSASSLEPGQVLSDSVDLVRVDRASSALHLYGAVPGPLWIWTGRSQAPVPFTVNASFDVAGAELYLVSGADFRVRVFESGELRKVHAVGRSPRPAENADLESYRAFVEEYVPEQMRAAYLSALDHEVRPNVLPGYDRVLTSSDGGVWAQVYDPDIGAPHDWDVFDPEGRLLGEVHVAAGVYPLLVTENAVVGIWRDPLGVEHVQEYQFTRPQ